MGSALDLSLADLVGDQRWILGAAIVDVLGEGPVSLESHLIANCVCSMTVTEVSRLAKLVREKKLSANTFFVRGVEFVVTDVHERFYCCRAVDTTPGFVPTGMIMYPLPGGLMLLAFFGPVFPEELVLKIRAFADSLPVS